MFFRPMETFVSIIANNAPELLYNTYVPIWQSEPRKT